MASGTLVWSDVSFEKCGVCGLFSGMASPLQFLFFSFLELGLALSGGALHGRGNSLWCEGVVHFAFRLAFGLAACATVRRGIERTLDRERRLRQGKQASGVMLYQDCVDQQYTKFAVMITLLGCASAARNYVVSTRLSRSLFEQAVRSSSLTLTLQHRSDRERLLLCSVALGGAAQYSKMGKADDVRDGYLPALWSRIEYRYFAFSWEAEM